MIRPARRRREVVCGCFFFSSRRRHTRCSRDWSSDVCSSDLGRRRAGRRVDERRQRIEGADDHEREQRERDRVAAEQVQDRKSTRLNSSHGYISYAVFCLKKKKKK